MKNKKTPQEVFMKTTFFALFTMLLCSLGAAEPAPKGSPYGPTVEIPDGYRCEYTEDIRNRPLFRGVMSPDVEKCTVKDLEDLASWGANLIRWQIGTPKDKKDLTDIAAFEAWYAKRLDDLEKLMPAFERLGIHVIIDMHTPPGGRYKVAGELPPGAIKEAAAFAQQFRMFSEKKYLDSFIRIWRQIATRFKGQKNIWGYDLCNEPCQNTPVPFNYWDCQYRAAKAIRELDPHTPVIIESNGMCGIGSYADMQPLPLKNIIYQVHIYIPGSYTHQGIGASWKDLKAGKFVTYPKDVGGKRYLRSNLETVRSFQEEYGAIIFCGEFSAIRWAPGAEKYVRDVISLCEEYGWSWTYHAFRESHFWSVEHEPDFNTVTLAKEDTPLKKVLLKYFSRNRR